MILRRLFETRKPRERLLLTVFLWLILLLWFIVLGRAWRGSLVAYNAAETTAHNQRLLIDNSTDIDARLASAQAMIDKSRTYNGIQLSSAVDTLARESDLPADIRSPDSHEEGIFNTYTVRVDARRATLQQIMMFTQAVRQKAPYLALRSLELRSNSRDPRQLDASIVVESFELTESTF